MKPSSLKFDPQIWTVPVLSHTANWFKRVFAGREVTDQNRTTQTGVHFEEVAEMLDEMRGMDSTVNVLIDSARRANHDLAEYLKSHPGCFEIRDRVKFLDAICDQMVTGAGTAELHQMDVVGGLNAVNMSNYSKFDEDGNPIFDPETMKVKKGPGYYEPNLSYFV